jgi:opacity protein-like surface antigen
MLYCCYIFKLYEGDFTMKLTQSLVAIAALTTLSSTLSFAGGDINPVTVFEQEPVSVPVEVPYVAPAPEPVEEYVAPAPEPVEEYVAPTPAPAPEPAPAPAPTPAPVTVTPPAPVAPVVAAAKPLGLYLAGGLTDIAVRTTGRANFFKKKIGQDRQLGFTGRLGYDFMDYLGAELRGTYGLSKVNAPYRKFKQVGAYLKPNYDVTDALNLYGLLGASKTNFSGAAPTQTGFSYGLGLDYGISDKVSVFTDVVNYLRKSGTPSAWGLTLGAAYQF